MIIATFIVSLFSFDDQKNKPRHRLVSSIMYTSEIIKKKTPLFLKGYLDIDGAPCDTFVRLDGFTKGFVTVNGFNLGRYWEIGPQRSLYVPASLLKEGENEIVVFESDGIKGSPMVEFKDFPTLG